MRPQNGDDVQTPPAVHMAVAGPIKVAGKLHVNVAMVPVTPEIEAAPFTRPLTGAPSVGQGLGVHSGAVATVHSELVPQTETVPPACWV